MDADYENLRTALQFWKTEGETTDNGTMLARLVSALHAYWSWYGNIGEGQKWWGHLLATHYKAGTIERREALFCSGFLARQQGDLRAMRRLREEALTISKELGDNRGVAAALLNLGDVFFFERDFGAAHALFEESLVICQEFGNESGIAVA